MGALYQRFKLINTSAGELVIDRPGGWRDAIFKSKRGEFHEMDTDYISDLRFSKESREYILNVESTQGVNAEILITFETSNNKTSFTEQYRGRLDLSELREFNEKAKYVECSVTQINFKSLFKKRRKEKINLNDRAGLDGNVIANYPNNVIQNTGRALLQEYDGEYSNEIPSLNFDGHVGNHSDIVGGNSAFYNIGFQQSNVNELQVFDALSLNNQPISLLQAEFDGEYEIALDFDVDIQVNCFRNSAGFPANPSDYVFDLRYQIDESTPVISNSVTVNSSNRNILQSYSATLNETITLTKGQKLYIYGRIYVNIGGTGDIFYYTTMTGGTLTIQSITTFKPTTTKSYMLHDAFSIIVDSITGGDKAFYSEYLGNTVTSFRTYEENGEWSFMSICSGYDLREIDRDYSVSFDELYEAINAITPLAISFERINGKDVIRIEHVSYAYSSQVQQTLQAKYINREVDKDVFYNKIESGFNKWEAENVNGLNEPNGKREYATVLKDIGEEYKITTNFIAAGQVMEVTRRKADEKTTDTTNDKNIFLLCLKRTLSGSTSIELNLLENDENFNSVSGIIQPDSAVNLRISPTMNTLRHGLIINSGLIKYPDTDYKLTASEGNITMVTNAVGDWAGDYNSADLSEGQNITWTYDERLETSPLFSGNLLKFTTPMTFTEYVAIKSSVPDSSNILTRHKIFQVTDGATTKAGWITEIEYDHSDNPVAKITLREANNSIFGISTQPIEFILTENGLFLQTEDDLNYISV